MTWSYTEGTPFPIPFGKYRVAIGTYENTLAGGSTGGDIKTNLSSVKWGFVYPLAVAGAAPAAMPVVNETFPTTSITDMSVVTTAIATTGIYLFIGLA
jgi:hypothetical protein